MKRFYFSKRVSVFILFGLVFLTIHLITRALSSVDNNLIRRDDDTNGIGLQADSANTIPMAPDSLGIIVDPRENQDYWQPQGGMQVDDGELSAKLMGIQHRLAGNDEIEMWKRPRDGIYNIPSSTRINETSFTVVMLTHNRTSVMLRTASHFLSMAPVRKVIILWNNQGIDPPSEQLQEIESTYNKPLVVKIFTENKIRLRFHLYPEIDTAAFFSVDDDLIITPRDMNLAFNIWKSHAHAVVGFTPRGHTGSAHAGFKYDYLPRLHSIILTNAAFVHREYIRMFEEHVPKGVHDLVDTLQNCEDIALNFLVSNYCRCQAAICVRNRGKWLHYGQQKGLWKTGNHKQERDFCVDTFAKYFPALPQRALRRF